MTDGTKFHASVQINTDIHDYGRDTRLAKLSERILSGAASGLLKICLKLNPRQVIIANAHVVHSGDAGIKMHNVTEANISGVNITGPKRKLTKEDMQQ